ncbi:unnamed protein product, partial [Discosporangium mesarthrocarpum]
MTRAKQRLFLTWRMERIIFGWRATSSSEKKGASFIKSNPSPFLKDLPKALVRHVN